MKTQRKSSRYASRTVLLLAVAALLFSVFAPFILTQKASALGETYILYYPDDEDTKLKLKEAYNKSEAEQFEAPIMEKVSIMGYGGTMFGDTPQRLIYDMDVNKQMNKVGNIKDDKDGSEQYFSRVYYCNASTGERTYSAPEGQDKYYRITYVVALTDMHDASKLFDVGTHNLTAVGATKILKITPAKAGGVGQAGETQKTETIKELSSGTGLFDESDGPGSLDDSFDKVEPAACRPSPLGENKVSVKNYYKDASAADKEAIKSLVEGADNAASGPGGSNTDNPNCDISLSPLSWIVCPLVDMGTAFTDFVFNTFVRGLLEDVPIETEDGNGSYEAWKQFRLLGNVLLIGALLAVVYSQAKGSK